MKKYFVSILLICNLLLISFLNFDKILLLFINLSSDKTKFEYSTDFFNPIYANFYRSFKLDKSLNGIAINLNNFQLLWATNSDDKIKKNTDFYLNNYELFYLNQEDEDILSTLGITLENVKKAGGIKTIFSINNNIYTYVTFEKNGCGRGVIFNMSIKLPEIEFPCLPDNDLIDLGSSGGAFIHLKDGTYLLTTGTPTSASKKIKDLAQDQRSPYGKILRLNLNSQGKLSYTIFSSGHRNPQGIFEVNNTIFSTEHGPKGGDELNIIRLNSNYGWPDNSLGSNYDLSPINKSPLILNNINSVLPFYSFVPSIGINSIADCPVSYAKYYIPLRCISVSSLKDGSIYIIVLNPSLDRVLFSERLHFNYRIRKFKFIEDTLFAITDNHKIIIGKLLKL
jgi:hypothetical protein